MYYRRGSYTVNYASPQSLYIYFPLSYPFRSLDIQISKSRLNFIMFFFLNGRAWFIRGFVARAPAVARAILKYIHAQYVNRLK